MRNDDENTVNYDCDPRNPANCSGRFASTGLVTKYPAGTTSPFVALGVTGRKADFGLGNKADTQLYTSNIAWAGDNFTVNVITGFINLKQKYLLDFADGRGLPSVSDPIPIVHAYPTGGLVMLNDGKHNQFTQEIKISGTILDGKIDYVTGLHYLHEDNKTDFADIGTVGIPTILADRTLVKLTAGIRYTDEEKTIGIFDNRASCQPSRPACLETANLIVARPDGTVVIPTSQRTKVWTPRFALNYKPSDATLFFASATKGFKSGGWNARGTAPNTLLPFDPEKLWSYELGVKTAIFDQRVRVILTGFRLEAKNLQTPAAFIDPASSAATFITRNVAGYRNKGVELELSAVPMRGLTVYANLGYQNDKYKVSETLSPDKYGIKSVRQQQIDCLAQLAAKKVPLAPAGSDNVADCAAGIIDANGNIATPARTPDFSIAFGGSYDFPIPVSGIILTPSVNALYRSRLETSSANGSIFSGNITAPSGAVFPSNPYGSGFVTGSQARAVWQVGAALTMRTDDNNWTLSLECENCLDKASVQSSFLNVSYLSPPRTWQVRAKRVF